MSKFSSVFPLQLIVFVVRWAERQIAAQKRKMLISLAKKMLCGVSVGVLEVSYAGQSLLFDVRVVMS